MNPNSLSLAYFSGRLGPHHFAYLRAVAEGLDIVGAARRYLSIGHAAQALQAHRVVVERVRAVARRRADPHWRLIGIEIREPTDAVAQPAPLHEWAEAEGLGDWSEAELLDLHAERFGHADPAQRRCIARNTRLRERRLQLLRELEAAATTTPAPTDRLDGWLPPELAGQLRLAGALTLADLQRRIVQGGRWWRGLHAFGPVKAQRLAHYVQALIGAFPERLPVPMAMPNAIRLSGRDGSNRARNLGGGIEAQDDRQAIRAWITARAGSPFTARQYEREAERFILWCTLERRKALSDATAQDCRAYMDFLANIPDAWISRRKAARFAPGWAPFRGQLTLASQRLCVAALHSLFAWLVQARYLAANPWVLVNRHLGDDATRFDDSLASRAFTPEAWAALHAHLRGTPPSASTERLRWLCIFVEATGLRAAELP